MTAAGAPATRGDGGMAGDLFRPPHDFDCPVCFPPSEHRLWPLLAIVLAPVFIVLALRWLEAV